MSTNLMRESSDFDDSTSNDEELYQENDPFFLRFDHKPIDSNSIIDNRLINLYRIKRRKEDRKRQKLQKPEKDQAKQPEDALK